MSYWLLCIGVSLFTLAVIVPNSQWRRMPSPRHALKMTRPSRPTPDYRLIWDLEEELGFEHLTMDRRPAPAWTAKSDPVDRAIDQWKNLAMNPGFVPEDTPLPPVNGLIADMARLDAHEWAVKTQQANLRRAREKALLSSVDRSLRSSGERGFL